MSARRPAIAFQGELGAFSQEAARRLCGPGVHVLPCPRFLDIFDAVRSGAAAGAVVPIENTLAGSVHENYDHLVNFELPIVAETSVRIVHNLIARNGVRFSQLKRVFSHPVALNQCLDFFAANPQIERIPFYDTAGSIKMIAEEGLTTMPPGSPAPSPPKSTALTSCGAPSKATARISPDSSSCAPPNTPGATPSAPPPNTVWKTSLVFSTRNIPGALFRALSAFALRDLNLMKIESRPLRGKPWEYLFYLDFLGRADSPVAVNALNHLREIADFLRILGCYPKGA